MRASVTSSAQPVSTLPAKTFAKRFAKRSAKTFAKTWSQRAARRAPLFAIAWLFASGSVLTGAYAQAKDDRAYTIANYPVDAVAANAVKAKRDALASGRKSAFRSLLKRLVPATAYQRIKPLKALDPGRFLDGVRVRSEENSATQYIATLDFSFRADLVRRLLRERAIPFVDKRAPITSLILAYGPPSRGGSGREPEMSAKSGSSLWRSVWRDLDLKNSIAPLDLVKGNRGVKLSRETINGLVRGDARAVEEFVNAFGGGQVLFAYASPDPASGRLKTMIAGQDAVGRFSLARRYRLAKGDFAYALELAAVITQGILEGRWKARMAPVGAATDRFAAPAQNVTIIAEFTNLGQWQRQQRAIRQLPGVRDLQIGGIAGRRAQVALRYPGGAAGLQAALRAQGITLENFNGYWIMR